MTSRISVIYYFIEWFVLSPLYVLHFDVKAIHPKANAVDVPLFSSVRSPARKAIEISLPLICDNEAKNHYVPIEVFLIYRVSDCRTQRDRGKMDLRKNTLSQ